MTTTTHSRHRLTWRKRLSRRPIGAVLLALLDGMKDLFTFTPVLRVPRVLAGWRDLPLPTRSALGWIVVHALVLASAALLSDLPGKWWGAGLILAIGGVLLYLVLTGARMQQHALEALAAVLEREPVGGPVLCTAVAHCGCLHTFAWNEVAEAWGPVSVVQQPDCAQVVTV